MTDTPLPFAPFQPSPPTVPEKPAETPKQKAAREKREKKAAAAEKDHAREVAAAERPPSRQKRRSTGTPKASKRAPKFDLQTILAAASTLKEADMSAFEKMIGMLQDAGKPGRDRLLAALGKVFSLAIQLKVVKFVEQKRGRRKKKHPKHTHTKRSAVVRPLS